MTESTAQASPIRSRLLRALFWLVVAGLVIAFDQWTKQLVIEHFEEFEAMELTPMLELMRLHNEGAAFSFLAGASGWQRWMFIALGVGVSGGIAVWLCRLPARGHVLLSLALSLVMGGALGNVVDRIQYGYVIDFIRVHYEQWYFPAFNVADSAISVGAALLILDSLLRAGAKPESAQAAEEAGPAPEEGGAQAEAASGSASPHQAERAER